jgi:putative oxidoreductase
LIVGAGTRRDKSWGEITMDGLTNYAKPLGRLLMSSLFIWAGYTKLFVFGPTGTAGYFKSVNIPAPDVMAWVVIVIELIGGLLILVGFQTRWVALALAIFCLITGFAVHLPVGDQANMTHFYKNLALAGGFLYIFASGAGALSVDGEKS